MAQWSHDTRTDEDITGSGPWRASEGTRTGLWQMMENDCISEASAVHKQRGIADGVQLCWQRFLSSKAEEHKSGTDHKPSWVSMGVVVLQKHGLDVPRFRATPKHFVISPGGSCPDIASITTPCLVHLVRAL